MDEKEEKIYNIQEMLKARQECLIKIGNTVCDYAKTVIAAQHNPNLDSKKITDDFVNFMLENFKRDYETYNSLNKRLSVVEEKEKVELVKYTKSPNAVIELIYFYLYNNNEYFKDSICADENLHKFYIENYSLKKGKTKNE